MNPDSSPFTPSQPVKTEYFTGREKEIKDLLISLRKAAREELQIVWIGGERGMGKSSLASFIANLAEKQENAISVHVHLGEVETIQDMMHETYLNLVKETESSPWVSLSGTYSVKRFQKLACLM